MSDQITKDLGGITAYAAAVAAGYTGTKSQFETLMASYATVAQNAAASATAANGSAEDAEAYAVGTRDGSDVGSTDPAYHNNSKYYAELAEDYADSIDPDKIESHIDAAYIKETASGNIATFSDGAPAPVRNLVAEIVPLQSGSGDPSPSNVRAISGWTGANVHVCGINAWDEEWELGTLSSLDGSNVPSTTTIRSKNYIRVVPNTTYYVKSPNGLYVYGYDADKNMVMDASGGSKKDTTFTTPSNCAYIRFWVHSNYGTTYNHDISINYPSTDHDYHAYNGNTYTIDWTDEAGTVYGGRLDVTSGVLTVEWGGVDMGSLTWNNAGANKLFSTGGVNTIIKKASTNSDYFTWQVNPMLETFNYDRISTNTPYKICCTTNGNLIATLDTSTTYTTDEFASALSDHILAFELATPQTYQLTPTEVKSLLKNNNIWADTGDVTVEYVADTKTFIEELINA